MGTHSSANNPAKAHGALIRWSCPRRPHGLLFWLLVSPALHRLAHERVAQHSRPRPRVGRMRRLVQASLPREQEVVVPVVADELRISTERKLVERVPVAPDLVRAWLPLETYPISAGVKGGWAGSVAMAVLACTYGLLKAGSIWYPINLLAATVSAPLLQLNPSQLNSFHLGSFVIAVVLHGIGSTLVGLLYGAMLPMFPRRPILLGGLIAPVLWSGLLYSILNLLNPLLASHIDWVWFMASQVAFGVVAGLVVMRQERVSTRENLPFAMRAGVEAPGIMSEKRGKDESR